jgi:putative aldouronate transport system substrate-binding protein
MQKVVILSLIMSLCFSFSLSFSNEKKPEELSVISDLIVRDPDGRTEWIEEYEKLTGLKLDMYNSCYCYYQDKLKILFAAGVVKDIVEIPPDLYPLLASQKALYPLDDFISKSQVMKSVNMKYVEACRAPDGKIYGFPLAAGPGCVTYIRKDWLNKLGLNMPETWDELYTVMSVFTNKDPDGNGKNDTFGYTISFDMPNRKFDYYNRNIMQEAHFDFTKKSKKWIDGFTEPEMIPAIERFKKIYKEGIIDKEFFTNRTTAARAKFIDGKAGIYENWSGLWAELIEKGIKDNLIPNASFDVMKPIKGAGYISRMGPVTGIYAKSKYPESAFKYWIEMQVDKGAGQTLFVYGVRGVNYDIIDGKMKFLPTKSNPKELFTKAYIDPEFIINDWTLPIPFESELRLKSREILKNNSEIEGFIFGGVYFDKYSYEILKLKQQLFVKMVTEELSIEEGMKQYNEKVKDFKMAEIIKEINR